MRPGSVKPRRLLSKTSAVFTFTPKQWQGFLLAAATGDLIDDCMNKEKKHGRSIRSDK